MQFPDPESNTLHVSLREELGLNPDGIHDDITRLMEQAHPLKHPGRMKAVGVDEEKETIKDIFK